MNDPNKTLYKCIDCERPFHHLCANAVNGSETGNQCGCTKNVSTHFAAYYKTSFLDITVLMSECCRETQTFMKKSQERWSSSISLSVPQAYSPEYAHQVLLPRRHSVKRQPRCLLQSQFRLLDLLLARHIRGRTIINEKANQKSELQYHLQRSHKQPTH